MKKVVLQIILLCLLSIKSFAQLKSGPMLGHVDYRTATIWVEFMDKNQTAILKCWPKNGDTKKLTSTTANPPTNADAPFNIQTYTFVDLEPGTDYEYEIETNTPHLEKKKRDVLKKVVTGTFKTQDLWLWRKPAPDFSFLTGSCAFFNQSQYDRPGKSYGNDSAIFEVMAKTPASFMLWLGDNWYTREVDFYSDWGLYYRASITRSLPILQNFWKAMPHYAIWDDHDYGWNDAEKSYPLKRTSRRVFMDYWTNPSYGEEGEGIYTKITKNDVDFFLLDDRWFRCSDALMDSVNGRPNPDKLMWGKKQMDWLKSALANSKKNMQISFRIIATGSPVLNPLNIYDCAVHYPVELDELKNFIKDNKIENVIFLDGDRHVSEIIEIKQDNMYPLYDITASPLTSGVYKYSGAEKNNPYRIIGIDNTQSFSKITISGQKNDRTLKVEFISPKGDILQEWSINEKMLKFPNNTK